MGVPPSGEIVARPVLKRACGCMQEFQYYAVDKFRAQRQAKFQRTRCPTCVAKLVEEQRLAATLPKRGEVFRTLPLGTQVAMDRRPDGVWSGSLTAEGRTVEATGECPLGLVLTLGRLWVAGQKKAAT